MREQEFTNNEYAMKRLFLTFFGMSLLLSIHVRAQDFVYTPINPFFGGNTFNYQWLMSSAQSQNIYKAKPASVSAADRYKRNPVDDFAESLNRQILSRLSREIISKQFGEEGLSEGTYVLGDYQIDVGNSDEGITISILDNTTGATTNVTVPFF